MKRRSLLSSGGALALAAVLPACGGSGGSSSGSYRLRLINASPDFASLDLYLDSTLSITGTAFGSASAYVTSGTTSVTTALAATGSSSYAASTSRSITAGRDYTMVAYGWSSGLKTQLFADAETAANSGETKLRIIHAATDAGSIDVYLTGEADSLSSSSPLNASVGAGNATGYTAVKAGTYRLRITGAGNVDDVRMDVSGVSLTSTQVLSLITVPGRSGVLVSGLLAQQGGDVTALAGNQARVRVVASVSDNATVQVTVGNTTVMDGVRSPTVGSYATLTAGNLPIAVLVNGVAVAVPNQDLAAGTDTTLLVGGTSASPTVSVIHDDNRLPTGSSTCKIRLMHAASSLAGSGMTMTINYSAIASGVAVNTASSYVELASVTSALIDVSNPLALQSVYSAASVALVSGAIYTVYVLMGSSGPAGVLRRER